MDEQNKVSDKVLPKEKVVPQLEAEFDSYIYDLENNLLPNLKHGEVKRLFMAVAKYPKEVADFSQESNLDLIRAFSVSKAAKDTLVGLATEVVIERLINRQMEEQAGVSTTERGNPDEVSND
jgi:regulatory protein YycH of two-component signal transduction system YycFG